MLLPERARSNLGELQKVALVSLAAARVVGTMKLEPERAGSDQGGLQVPAVVLPREAAWGVRQQTEPHVTWDLVGVSGRGVPSLTAVES